jgi:NAD(P)H-dependent FMN reductase
LFRTHVLPVYSISGNQHDSISNCRSVGSLRRDSFNRKLANAVLKLAPSEFSFNQLQIDDLPLYNQDDDENPAEPVKRLKNQISAAQGLLFVTPEYNRSIPGVLKNAIDHASRPYGQNAWAGKPAGVLGASIGAYRYCLGATALAKCSCISRRTDTGPTRGIHPGQGRVV